MHEADRDRASLLSLWDYRRRVTELYREVRGASDAAAAWERWRRARDELFAAHPQSALDPEARAGFAGLSYFPYDPRWALVGDVEPLPGHPLILDHSGEGTTAFRAIGQARFEFEGETLRLPLYWLDTYGGGVFLPFRDLTSGTTTYGGGRYLLDTAKGADLGHDGTRVRLDFNFAYHPSCVHGARWSCPLAPPDNRLPVAVEAGERLP